MAQVIHQSFHRDPALQKVVGITKVRIISVKGTITLPAVVDNKAVIVRPRDSVILPPTITLTVGTNDPVNGEFFRLAGKLYTFRDTIGNCVADGDMVLSTTVLDMRNNLIATINADPAQAGILFYANTAPNPRVYATALAATTLTITSKSGYGFDWQTKVNSNTWATYAATAGTGTAAIEAGNAVTEPIIAFPTTPNYSWDVVTSTTASTPASQPLSLLRLNNFVIGDEVEIITYHGDLAGVNYSANA